MSYQCIFWQQVLLLSVIGPRLDGNTSRAIYFLSRSQNIAVGLFPVSTQATFCIPIESFFFHAFVPYLCGSGQCVLPVSMSGRSIFLLPPRVTAQFQKSQLL